MESSRKNGFGKTHLELDGAAALRSRKGDRACQAARMASVKRAAWTSQGTPVLVVLRLELGSPRCPPPCAPGNGGASRANGLGRSLTEGSSPPGSV